MNKAGAARDPTPQQRGCHPERRSVPAAPRQGIKTASAAAGKSGERARHCLVRQDVEARITQRTVEIFLRGKRVASHLRSTLPHRPTTVAEHTARDPLMNDFGAVATVSAKGHSYVDRNFARNNGEVSQYCLSGGARSL